MITRDTRARTFACRPGLAALTETIGLCERAGALRCAAVLYADRLPSALAKPHHRRLARQALDSLVAADRAQSFELPLGRIAIIWRDHGGPEFQTARAMLEHLLGEQPALPSVDMGNVLCRYDLPSDAERLLDDLTVAVPPGQSGDRIGIDLKLLAALEANLARADLSGYLRIRPVMPLRDAPGADVRVAPVWEDRHFAVDDLAADLSPGRDLRGDPTLFGRLTRTLDRRMLSLLSAPGVMARTGPFAININVATILGPEFLRFDRDLPNHLRGEVILILRAPDILADCVAFAVSRNFARTRSYRLALAGVTASLLDVLDVVAAGIDLLYVTLTPSLREQNWAWQHHDTAGCSVVLGGIDRPSDLRWASRQGFCLGRGRQLNPSAEQTAASGRSPSSRGQPRPDDQRPGREGA